MAKKYYDPEYDRIVDEKEVRRQFDYFAGRGWCNESFEAFAADNFQKLRKYLEYSESGWFVRDSDNLEDMKEDVNEFGGCIVNHDGDFIAGFEWAYDEIKSNL